MAGIIIRQRPNVNINNPFFAIIIPPLLLRFLIINVPL